MSKTVIVFSTYSIYKHNQKIKEGVFTDKKTNNPCLFTSGKIKDFFWHRLQKDVKYCTMHLPYNVQETKDLINEALDEALEKKRLGLWDRLFDYITRKQLQKKYPELSHIIEEQLAANADDGVNAEDDVNRQPNITKGRDCEWLFKSDTLTSDCYQEPFMIYSTAGFDETTPWLRNRLSYYKLIDNNEGSHGKTSVYAVWALSPCEKTMNDGIEERNEWIDALAEQFFSLEPDADKMYLVLHDKDIMEKYEKRIYPYKYEDEKERTLHVLLFQHTDEIGDILKKNSTIEEIEGTLFNRRIEVLNEPIQDIMHGKVMKYVEDKDGEVIEDEILGEILTEMKNEWEKEENKSKAVYKLCCILNRELNKMINEK